MASNKCIVHSRLNVIDLNVLINICDEISLDKSSETINLSFEPETDSRECHRRISRFIGKKGQNLNTLQDKYDVGIHITNGSSNKAFKRNTKLENVAKLRNIVNLDKLDVLIRRKHPSLTTDTISMDEIKQELNAKWKEASEFEFIQKELSFDHNHFQFVCLSFESERSLHERREIIGRFIGKKGENLRSLEDQYNIRLHIMNDATFNRKHIQKIVNEQNENNFYFLSLLFESEISLQGRRRKISRFIGKNGEHIRGLQDKYNIRIQIVDQSFSRKIVQKKFAKIQDKDKLDKLYLLVTNKNKITTEKIRIVKIKEDINKLWENEEEINNLNHTQSSELNFLSMSSIQLNSDNRWNKKFFMSLKSYCTHSICIFPTHAFDEPKAITQFANEAIRVLRPNGYLLWCDFCYINGSGTSVYDLIASDELIIEEKINITKNVVHALDIQNKSRTDFIQRYIQPEEQEYFRLFAGLPGTQVYEDLNKGRSQYWRVVFRKKPTTDIPII
ncbi:unnamed protein product [Adineta steineri]|uniref:K Homology domain-containing protein n=1 Tax=Adineta steineri TaxID=433720 RepID=A0A815N366_9BILA|nr:unnamed protein product [Adineta steineri]